MGGSKEACQENMGRVRGKSARRGLKGMGTCMGGREGQGRGRGLGKSARPRGSGHIRRGGAGGTAWWECLARLAQVHPLHLLLSLHPDIVCASTPYSLSLS
ncbi:hypothetical protein Pcinc_042320 [Petrolisthes cinctipes]|uniref:Uncharacterized protein n=1 Tax=Petrolisthes cinctipes TaxID=88211 RepID=A0AAE1BKW1_PETCI|nr:hypothetical protein Pcinc_042320 [Petrolisthes cinctipes]